MHTILIIGSGGREHALAWKLRQSPQCGQLFVAPGNAGTTQIATNLPLDVTDFEGIKAACLAHAVSLVVVGPEAPLVAGIYDFFQADAALRHIAIIAPSQAGAQLEGSKDFAKRFMQQYGIPTARYRTFTQAEKTQALSYVQQHPLPVVLKADGLAAGKGVVICTTSAAAVAEMDAMLSGKFGDASARVVVEEFLDGIEFSVFVLTDGTAYKVLPVAKDYKRVGECDTGLNTGGMGAVSPVPFADATLMKKVRERIIAPTLRGLAAEQLLYTGFIFLGLINVQGEPFVIEYNCRLGDPETEVVLPRLQSDLLPLLLATANGHLQEMDIVEVPEVATTVMVVAGGYPNDYEKGNPITGWEVLPTEAIAFHAGTALRGDAIVTNGGRVVALTSLAADLATALAQSNAAAAMLQFKDKYYRKDIGEDLYKMK